MNDAINLPMNMTSRNEPPRRNLSRMYKLLQHGYEIPFLVDFGDVSKCSNNLFQTSTVIVDSNHAFRNLHVPVFGMGRPRACNHSFPIPTNHLHIKENSGSWHQYFNESLAKYGPWESKTNKTVWRGSWTGSHTYKFGRHWLVDQGKEHSEWIDAMFIMSKHQTEGRMEFQDFQQFKGILDMDGNGWSGRFLGLLCMNSVVIKIKPHHLDYNFDQLREWDHYIPVNPEANDSVLEAVKLVYIYYSTTPTLHFQSLLQ